MVSGLMIGGAIAYCDSTVAQIVPDATLGSESSIVTPQTPDSAVNVISGGATRGKNLFHSFDQFSVQTGGTALFNNATDIQNIISRVTGSSISNIDGLIQANGTANLFLLNPNGIIFGQNARLDIRGSFVATTAKAIQFGTQGILSADNPEPPSPLLTVNPSALLFNQIAASIQNNSTSPAGLTPAGENSFGLRVPDGKSLLLVGRNISMDGGQLNAYGGRVELGGLSDSGTVTLQVDGDNLSLGFPDNVTRADISLTNSAGVSVESGGGGSITANARNIEILGGSFLSAGIAKGLGSVSSVAGDITLNATGEIKVARQRSFVFNNVREQAKGKGGNLIVNARDFLMEDGVQVAVGTLSAGRGGDLTINAQNSVQVIRSDLITTVQSGATGDAGNLTINTQHLRVLERGAEITTATFGEGKAGSLTVNATDSIQIVGNNGLFTSAAQDSTGDAGDLTINTRELLMQKGGRISASTLGPGKAGDITINTNNLRLEDGTSVSAGTLLTGKGGNLTIKADIVQLTGTSFLLTQANPGSTGDAGDMTISTGKLLIQGGAQVITSTFGAGKGGNLTVDAFDVQLIGRSADNRFGSGLFTSAQPNSTGDAGDLTITTNTLLVRDGARVSVQSSGTGTAGNMTVNANFIRLNNNALLSANTRNVQVEPNLEQATISINSKILAMSSNSNIRTNAIGENVIGGNINIDTYFLVADQNSDISANSTNFRGGNIRINAQGIFGTQLRDLPSEQTSDITATGVSREFSGNVEITTSDVDPSWGLAQLPTNLVDASQQIAQGCTPRGEQTSSFVTTGRGGLPDNPSEILKGDAIEVNLVTLDPKISRSRTGRNAIASPPMSAPIIEAQGWVIGKNGEVLLIASAPTVTSNNSGLTPESCNLWQQD
ncbi:S-layer family protein [Nostoc sp. LEGE 12447]|uniref:two-partner secretion domain-containing protein n=1 Tax=Nostoc sp. LEGE 12447 TaxID=1828640 RepID=UPI001882DFF8|nr:S-layer family protein [Nostoc sp. LEGE 12447]MBE8996649.1 S-layer family protein [Nostoc sp. LEGE 12447]